MATKDILLGGFYVASAGGTGVPGLTVTIDVWRVALADLAKSEIVTAGSATDIGDGVYAYRVAAANLQLYNYYGILKTADTTVVQKHLAAVMLDFADSPSIAELVWAAATRTLTAFAFGVTVTTNNDKTGYGLSAAAVQAIWDALTSALTAVGSIGKLLVDNINATISSRLASASYTAPDNATIGTINTNVSALGTAFAAVNTLVTAVKAKTDLLLFSANGFVQAILMRWLTDNAGGTPNALSSGNVPIGNVTLVPGQIYIRKNQALADFPFTMNSSLTHQPVEGLTVSGESSIDGGAFAPLTNSPVELENGWYTIDFSAADLNGATIAIRMSAPGADDRDFTIVTQP